MGLYVGIWLWYNYAVQFTNPGIHLGQNFKYDYSTDTVIHTKATSFTNVWIRIRMDLELLPGSGIIVPDPAKYERADK